MFSKKNFLVIALFSSLPLACAFQRMKIMGKCMVTVPLTGVVVAWTQINMPDKKAVALHEAAHAVIAEVLQPCIVTESQIKDQIIAYSGHVNFDLEKMIEGEPDYLTRIKKDMLIYLAGFTQDELDSSKMKPKNLMEREFELPLSAIGQSKHSVYSKIYNHVDYKHDAENAAGKAFWINIFENGYINPEKDSENEDDILSAAYKTTKKLVRENQLAIQAVGKALSKKEYLSGDEIRAIIAQVKK